MALREFGEREQIRLGVGDHRGEDVVQSAVGVRHHQLHPREAAAPSERSRLVQKSSNGSGARRNNAKRLGQSTTDYDWGRQSCTNTDW